MPLSLAGLETPCLLVDLGRAEANLRRAQAEADRLGLKLRPHIKTHKLPRFARQQAEIGGHGITVQKLGEAEVMADAGLDDIFLPYNILGTSKLARLKALNERIVLAVTADSPETVAGYAATFSPKKALTVLVECDTGLGRCGVPSPAQALGLARQIALAAGLRFGGLMTYPAKGRRTEAEAWLAEARATLEAAGLSCPVISSGGTPDLYRGTAGSVVTEYRPGTYIYNDRMQVAAGSAEWDDCALTVVATVVSRPTARRAVIDAGSKTLSSDTGGGLEGYGRIIGYEDATIRSLSEEHGVIDLAAASDFPRVGEMVRIVPNHVCVVVNLFDTVHLVSADGSIEAVPVAARGKVQ